LRKENYKGKIYPAERKLPLTRKVLQQEKYSTQGHLNILLPGVENLFTDFIPPVLKPRLQKIRQR
jgi:hypothetical protein